MNPQHQQKRNIRQSCRYNSVPNRFSSRFLTSRTNGPRSLSRAKAGTHSAFGEKSHTRAYTAKQGAFRMGALLLPSERFTRFGNPARPGGKTAYFAASGSWPGALSENAESLRDSDAHERIAVPKASRSRWAAHTYAVNTSIFPAEFFSQSQKTGKKSHSLMFHIHVFDCTA